MAEFNDIGFNSSNDIGKKGELFYLNYVKTRGFDYLDVSDDQYFQSIDVDFAVSTTRVHSFNDKSLNQIKKQVFNKQRQDPFILVDVKTDTVGGKTGNFYLEWIAHYKPGCFSITKADKWIYIYWNKEKDKPEKIWSIDVTGLRKAIVSGAVSLGHKTIEMLNGADFEIREYRSQKAVYGNDPGMYAWIVPMEYLKIIGVAKELEINT